MALHAGAGVVLAAAALRRRTRFEAGAAVEVAGDGVNGNLYIFGGHVQRGSHSFYYDDMWALEKQSSWRED